MSSEQAGERPQPFSAAHWSTACRGLARGHPIRPGGGRGALLAGAIWPDSDFGRQSRYLRRWATAPAMRAASGAKSARHRRGRRHTRPATWRRPAGPGGQPPGTLDDAPAFPGSDVNRAIPTGRPSFIRSLARRTTVAHPGRTWPRGNPRGPRISSEDWSGFPAPTSMSSLDKAFIKAYQE